MATFEVTIENITVHPHPNADRLEYAQVGLFNVVVPKGKYVTGEEVFYIPEYAILPEGLIIDLGLEGKLAGKKANRVKPVRLRGLVSQGLVAPLDTLDNVDRAKHNFAEDLNISKWEPEIPAALDGAVEHAAGLIRWIEIENIKKFPNMFQPGEHVIIDEKIHGTCTAVTVINPTSDNAKVMVASKGLGAKSLALIEAENNVYWRMFHAYNIREFATFIGTKYPNTDKVAIFGETYGNVQDLRYNLGSGLGFVLFDIRVQFSNGEFEWFAPETTEALAREFGMPLAPRLYDGPYDIEVVEKLAYGAEQVSGAEAHIREGVIVRPAADNLDTKFEGSRKIGKFVSDDYLTRSGGTEYS